ncbi:hypothetical protein [Dactylosporangium sp. CA-233914]
MKPKLRRLALLVLPLVASFAVGLTVQGTAASIQADGLPLCVGNRCPK